MKHPPGKTSLASGLALVTAMLLLPLPSSHAGTPIAFEGAFYYQDRLFDENGYTGLTQDLPIRYADVEVVASADGQVLATGSTNGVGGYSIVVALDGTTDAYVRCLSSSENDPDHHIIVVDYFYRTTYGPIILDSSTIHAITTETQSVDPSLPSSAEFGGYLIVDETGVGIAQAFNVYDCAVDAFDYLAEPVALGAYPQASEFIVIGWNFDEGANGSDYGYQGIFLTAQPTDTDAWSDTVVLHELGHWASDMFGGDDNPGGLHFLGDSDQDPRLSYGEGMATVFCAQVRDFRSLRLNGAGEPVDSGVSVYADLSVPPPVPEVGGLEFSYDFETGLQGNGIPIYQIGMANETNVTSVLWDLVDGFVTSDGSPVSDDDGVDGSGALVWDVLRNYLRPRNPTDWITVEDFHDGWFVRNGSEFLRPEVDGIFVDAGRMPLAVDEYEPDDDILNAFPINPLTYSILPDGRVVINEVDVLGERIELYNSGPSAVDLTQWELRCRRNGFPSTSFVFPPFQLEAGAFVTVHSGGGPNSESHLYGSSFLVFWVPGDDGACTVLDDIGTPVDFLRWDNVEGDDPSDAPIPQGLAWSGSLVAAAPFQALGRNSQGSDTDTAGDFESRDTSFGRPNFDSIHTHTLYPQGDRDLLELSVHQGELVTVHATAPHSDGRPILDLLDDGGDVLSTESTTEGIPALARLSVLAPSDTTFVFGVRNDSPFTEYALVRTAVFSRPDVGFPEGPVGARAQAAHESETADPVVLRWINGGVYDAVEVFRDDELVATLPGDGREFVEFLPGGLWTYRVRGRVGIGVTEEATVQVYAGPLVCFSDESFEVGTGGLVLEGTWGIGVASPFGDNHALRDGPGDYGNNADTAAELLRPVELLSDPILQFDHICATEPDRDFGLVEVSSNYGTTWTTVARYHGGDFPEWEDGVDWGDWKHASVDLSDYVGRSVRVRFRLISDAQVTADGWWIDDVQLSSQSCLETAEATSVLGQADELRLRLWPNPHRGRSTFRFQVPASSVGTPGLLELVGAGGRRLHRLWSGALDPGLQLEWDGTDARGAQLPAGVYFARLRTAHGEAVARLTIMP